MSCADACAVTSAVAQSSVDEPLACQLVLHRLGQLPLPAAAERKLKLAATAGALPPETIRRLAAELNTAAPSDAGAHRTADFLRSSSCKRQRPPSAPPAPPAPPARAEPAVWARLSESALWSASAAYYATQGSSAWESGDVPCHISCSALTASAYAAVCSAFLHGEARRSEPGGGEPGGSARALILDLGCGCGSLGVRVARELRALGHDDFTLVLADLDPAAALEQCRLPSAAGLVQGGWIDVAAFEVGAALGGADETGELELLLSGRRLGPGSVDAPLVLLANYFFDSLPCDILRVTPGAGGCDADGAALPLVEALSATSAAGPPFAYDALAPGARFGGGGRPDDELTDALLEASVRRAASRAAAGVDSCPALGLIPTGCARCLRRLEALRPRAGTGGGGPSPMLLLVGDKMVDSGRAASRLAGVGRAGPFTLSELPLFAVHGGGRRRPARGAPPPPISTCLVLEEIVEAARRVCARHAHGVPSDVALDVVRSPAMLDFDVAALLVGGEPAPGRTPGRGEAWARRAFVERLGGFGPAEMERLLAHMLERLEGPGRGCGHEPPVPLPALTSLVRLGRHDWHEWHSLRWHVRRRLPGATADEEAEAVEAATRSFDARVVLTRREWLRSQVSFGQWLYAVDRHAAALRVLLGGRATGGDDGAAARRDGNAAERGAAEERDPERLFLRACCGRKLGCEPGGARELLEWAAAAAHRGAARRLRALARK